MFNIVPDTGFPNVKDRIIRAVAVVYSDRLGEHTHVNIAPKYIGHHINYFNNVSRRTSEDAPTIVSLGADRDNVGVSLSSGVTYHIYYKLDHIPEEIKGIMDKQGEEYNVGDLLGINY